MEFLLFLLCFDSGESSTSPISLKVVLILGLYKALNLSWSWENSS